MIELIGMEFMLFRSDLNVLYCDFQLITVEFPASIPVNWCCRRRVLLLLLIDISRVSGERYDDYKPHGNSSDKMTEESL